MVRFRFHLSVKSRTSKDMDGTFKFSNTRKGNSKPLIAFMRSNFVFEKKCEDTFLII